MNYALLSLVFLIGAIVLGFTRKINTGLVAIGLSLFLGVIGGIKENDIMGGFPTRLFVMLLGVMYFFSIAQENGTLELLAKKVVSLAGKRTNLIPIIVYVFSIILSGIGPGTIPVMSLMAVFTMALAAELKVSPLLLSAISIMGAAAGGISSIAPTGIIGITLAAEQGITGIEKSYFMNAMLGFTIYAAILYVVLKGYKMKSETTLKLSEIPKFNRNQVITLIGMGLLVIGVIVFKYNVGLLSFSIALVLSLFRVANEKKAIANIPWSTLILVTGVNVLMSIVIKLGGIDLLASTLASFMTDKTASAIISLTAGIMSWFSSASGVVMPTLIPTVGDLIAKVGGNLSGIELISAITNAANVAGTSPISTGGALALASYVQNAHVSEKEQQDLFIKMFAVAIGGVLAMTIIAGIGLYRIF